VDLRSVIYRSYRSDFILRKGIGAPRTAQEWKRRVFLPILNGVPRDASMVELGCGSGEMLGILSDAGFTNVVGVDVSEEQVTAARAAGYQVELGDALGFLSSRREAADVIIGIDFLEHMTKDEIAMLMPAMAESMSRGGLLVIQTVNASGLHGMRTGYGDLTHMTLFNEGSIRQLLNVYGFEVIALEETGPRPIGVRGLVRVLLWRVIRTVLNAVLIVETGHSQQVWTENLIVTARRPHPKGEPSDGLLGS
jgi:SAM-dependent methyltransferase